MTKTLAELKTIASRLEADFLTTPRRSASKATAYLAWSDAKWQVQQAEKAEKAKIVKTPQEAAFAVFQAAYEVSPVNADTFGTFQAAQEAARKAGASYSEASNVAINAWDALVKQVKG